MRDHLKKTEEDLLVVHKQPLPADKLGREPLSPEAEALPADVEQLAARLQTIVDAEARTRLMTTIQRRFGNAFAARVVDAFQRGSGGPPTPPAGGTPSGSGQK